jgi:ketose-bisphosphate aldolase
MLIPYKDLLAEALAGCYAVGYFEAWDIYSLEAVLDAAEAEGKPVILGFGGVMMEPRWFDDRGLERLAALGLATAQSARVPVSFLLNEVSTISQVERGIQAGFNAIMLETSSLPFSENVRLTRKVVELAHAAGVAVESELGMLPDATGEMDSQESSQTDPEEARRFVSETGIDALSVSVGNVHILTSGQAHIDLDRLAAIHKNVDIPLVIHGGTGFPEEVIPQALALGVAKVNIGTVLKQAFLEGVTSAIHSLPADPSIQQVMGSRKQTDILQQGKLQMYRAVIHRMRAWNPTSIGEMTHEAF